MKTYKFTVYGTPVPKGRPRFAIHGGFPVVYTPKKTRDAEEHFRNEAISSVFKQTGKPVKPFSGKVMVVLGFFKPKPKSCKTEDWVQRPDADNMTKTILDSLNGVFWNDDSQIVSILAFKEFSAEARTEVEIRGEE